MQTRTLVSSKTVSGKDKPLTTSRTVADVPEHLGDYESLIAQYGERLGEKDHPIKTVAQWNQVASEYFTEYRIHRSEMQAELAAESYKDDPARQEKALVSSAKDLVRAGRFKTIEKALEFVKSLPTEE